MIRKEKRKIIVENNFFEEFLKIQKHFFKDLTVKIKQVKDKRQEKKVNYTPLCLNTQIIPKFSYHRSDHLTI